MKPYDLVMMLVAVSGVMIAAMSLYVTVQSAEAGQQSSIPPYAVTRGMEP